ncbi:MAG: hypothetical protein ACPLN0_05150 [Candidatus Hydrothermia bacterium]
MTLILLVFFASYNFDRIIFTPADFMRLPYPYLMGGRGGFNLTSSVTFMPGGIRGYEVSSRYRSFVLGAGYLDLGSLKETNEFGEIVGESRPGIFRGFLGTSITFDNYYFFFSFSHLRTFFRELNLREFWSSWYLSFPLPYDARLVLSLKMGTFFEPGIGVQSKFFKVFASARDRSDYSFTMLFNYLHKSFEGKIGFHFDNYFGSKSFKPVFALSVYPSKKFSLDYYYRYEPSLSDLVGIQISLR